MRPSPSVDRSAMQTVILAMSELEHDKRSWRCPGMVAASILLTLALNASLREQAALLREATGDSNEMTPLIITAVATLGQILAAVSLLVAETPRGEIPSREALIILSVGHVGSVFLKAYILSLGNAQGYLAAAFSEPVLAMIALWMVTSLPGRSYTWAGLISIGVGCSFLSMSLSTILNSERTSLIEALSCFGLVLRNIVMRHLIFNEKVTVSARGTSVITGFIVMCGCVIAFVYSLLSPVWIGPTFCALTSSLLSIGLAYVTTRILKSYNVLFASLFHVIALLLEALVMSPSQARPDWITSVAALVILAVGLFLFLKDWVESQATTTDSLISYKKAVNTHEQYTRVEFLLFSSMVIGVIFYVFQPKLSQRDLHTLSYVGLDKVIRRLLSVHKG